FSVSLRSSVAPAVALGFSSAFLVDFLPCPPAKVVSKNTTARAINLRFIGNSLRLKISADCKLFSRRPVCQGICPPQPRTARLFIIPIHGPRPKAGRTEKARFPRRAGRRRGAPHPSA